VSSAYLDASVILRVVLEQEPALKDWERIDLTVSNEIVRVECLRTIERFRHEGKLTDELVDEKRAATTDFLRAVDLVAVDAAVIARASRPFPSQVATLDAIHFATALLYEALLPPAARPLLFATHDKQLARAARAVNLEVIGA
jgi:predicted nucleic acid-binding protein